MFSDGYIDGIETVIPEYEPPKVSPENIPLPKQTEKVLVYFFFLKKKKDTPEFYDQTDYILDLAPLQPVGLEPLTNQFTEK